MPKIIEDGEDSVILYHFDEVLNYSIGRMFHTSMDGIIVMLICNQPENGYHLVNIESGFTIDPAIYNSIFPIRPFKNGKRITLEQ